MSLIGGDNVAAKRISKEVLTLFYIVFFFLLYIAMEDYDSKNQYEVAVTINNMANDTFDDEEHNIFIDLTESILYLFKGRQLVKKYPIAQGKPATPSPIGVWEIVTKARNWGSGFGSRWMGLNVPWGKYGIHGTNRPGSIGYRASAGCFRMRNKDVEELYSLVPYRTKVIVYGGPFGNLGSQLIKLSPGDRNSHVLEVQKRLKKKGYYLGSLDGIYGEGMKKALIEFKRDHNLLINHYVDWATYKAMDIIAFE
jgi:hypothetical protein